MNGHYEDIQSSRPITRAVPALERFSESAWQMEATKPERGDKGGTRAVEFADLWYFNT